MVTFATFIFVVLVILGFSLLEVFHQLTRLSNRAQNAFVQINLQLKRRNDLISHLVEIAEDQLGIEQETLDSVTKTQKSLLEVLALAILDPMDGAVIRELANHEKEMSKVLSLFDAAIQSYPESDSESKAYRNITELKVELSDGGKTTAFYRKGFNDQVISYNNYKHFFPGVLFARTYAHRVIADTFPMHKSDLI